MKSREYWINVGMESGFNDEYSAEEHLDYILDIIDDFDTFRRLLLDKIKVAGTDKDNITIEKARNNFIEIKRRLSHKFPDQKKEIKAKVQEFESVCNLLKDPQFYLQSKQVTEEAYYFKRLAGIIR